MIGRFPFNIMGFFIGTMAGFHTAACLVQPIHLEDHAARKIQSEKENEVTLFDFTQSGASVNNWVESSDTVRTPGMSKAVIVLQKTQLFQRAILFTLLNPQPNGAGFAGVQCKTDFDLGKSSSLKIKLRRQGDNSHYKVILRHHGDDSNAVGYEHFFETSLNTSEEIILPFSGFQPYWRGKPVSDAGPLDISNITSFGFQVYGGVYSEFKQSGASSLEIDWVKATN